MVRGAHPAALLRAGSSENSGRWGRLSRGAVQVGQPPSESPKNDPYHEIGSAPQDILRQCPRHVMRVEDLSKFQTQKIKATQQHSSGSQPAEVSDQRLFQVPEEGN